jgi:uncharacterized membrane protein YeaQ/YmgE (transglycosylase-associated protein family)
MDLDIFGWIIVGLLAGWLSGVVVPGSAARGCLANTLVGILGGLLGGFIARELGFGGISSFLGAVLVAFVGAVVVRVVINAVSGPEQRF